MDDEIKISLVSIDGSTDEICKKSDLDKANLIIKQLHQRIAELEKDWQAQRDFVDKQSLRIAELEATRVPDELLEKFIVRQGLMMTINDYEQAEAILTKRKDRI